MQSYVWSVYLSVWSVYLSVWSVCLRCDGGLYLPWFIPSSFVRPFIFCESFFQIRIRIHLLSFIFYRDLSFFVFPLFFVSLVAVRHRVVYSYIIYFLTTYCLLLTTGLRLLITYYLYHTLLLILLVYYPLTTPLLLSFINLI